MMNQLELGVQNPYMRRDSHGGFGNARLSVNKENNQNGKEKF